MLTIYELSKAIMAAHAGEMRTAGPAVNVAAYVERYMSQHGLAGDSIDATGPAHDRVRRVAEFVRGELFGRGLMAVGSPVGPEAKP